MNQHTAWVSGEKGVEVEIALMHTRYFQPDPRDGAPHSVRVEVDGWQYGRDGVSATLCLQPEQALEFGLALLRIASEAQSRDILELLQGHCGESPGCR